MAAVMTVRARARSAGSSDIIIRLRTGTSSSAGLTRSLELLRDEGEVIELSFYGDRPVTVPLGEVFHPRRLSIRSSQVGGLSPARRSSRTYADRVALALDLLADPAFDALVTGESPFDDLPGVMARLASGELPALCHRIVYPGGPPCTASPSATT